MSYRFTSSPTKSYSHSCRKSTYSISTRRRTRTVRRGRVGDRRPDFLPPAKTIQGSQRRGTFSRVQNFHVCQSARDSHALSASSVRCEDIAPTLAEMLP
eukprot:scaffold665684_cov79-Prasinocladus_malaysianus.AAC.1